MSIKLKYFVINPASSDKEYAATSRAAMREFAKSIAKTDKELANDLRDWADSSSPALQDSYIDYNVEVDSWPLGYGK